MFVAQAFKYTCIYVFMYVCKHCYLSVWCALGEASVAAPGVLCGQDYEEHPRRGR